MNFIRNRVAILFVLALLITSGCKIIPWFGDYSSTTTTESFIGEIILSRNIETSQALNFTSPGFKLSIPAGALRYDAKIEITRYPLLASKMGLPPEYRPVSELFSIKLLPITNTLNQAATLRFTAKKTLVGNPCFAAYRNAEGEWKFASPLPYNAESELTFETLSFSDWVLVERVKDFPGSLAKGMQITASPSAAIASSTGFFEEDLKINLNLHSNQPLLLSPVNSQLQMQISTHKTFTIDVTNPDETTGSRNYKADNENVISLDLLNSSIATIKIAGNNATCSFLVKLKGKTPGELPDFLAMNALYTTEGGISYTAAQTLTFSAAPATEEPTTPVSPQITDTLPTNGATFVASSTSITLVFDQKMNLESVQNAFKINDRAGNAVSGTFAWQEDHVMIFSPDQPLLPTSEYAINFIDGAVGQNGLALVYESEIVFTTISNEPAELRDYTPANNATAIDYNAPIVLKFSQPLDPQNLKFTLTPALPGDFTATWNETKTEVSILYGSGFASNQVYEVNLLNSTLDLYGQPIKTAYVFSFTSKEYVANRLLVVNPASGSSSIAPDSAFVFTFDAAMSEADVVGAISFSPALTDATHSWSDGSTKLTVSHASALQTGTNYLVTIAKTDANKLITSYVISYGVVEPLQITTTEPANGSSGLTTDNSLKIRFNNPINTGTLAITFNPEPESGFSQTWGDNNTSLLLTPAVPGLKESTSYQISILAATTDIYGSSLTQNQVFTFSTGAFTPPIIEAVQPANNATSVATDRQIVINFSKSMDRSKTEAALTIQPAVQPLFTWQNSDKVLTISFNESLTAGTRYSLSLSPEVTDRIGLKLAAPYSSAFTTAAPVSNDPTAVVSYEPANNATAVAAFAPVTLRFSAPISKATLAFAILPAIPGDYTTTWNEAGTEADIAFNSGFASGINYKFSLLNTTKDIYGRAISEPEDFRFTAATYSAARLLTVSPASGSVNISSTSVFELTFDRAMNKADVEGAITIAPVVALNYQWLNTDSKLKITPTTQLAFASEYRLNVPKTVKAADNSELMANYLISWKTAPRLQVSETMPTNNTAGLPLRPTLEILFNNSVNTSTLTTDWQPAPPSGFSKIWSNNNTTLTLVPNADLLESRNYLITIGQATADTLGTTLGSNYVLNITTGAVTPPVISSTLPAAGTYDVPVDQQIKVVFSKPMDRNKTQAAVSVSPVITPTFSWENSDTTMIINLGDNLNYDTSYQITLGTGVTDKYGLTLAQSYIFAFKTSARPAVITTRCHPLANATAISSQVAVKIEFSKAMNKESAQTAFSLKEGSTVVNGSFSWNGNIMNFTPAANLTYDQLHQINIAASARDSLGNGLSSAVSWSFTTAADEGKIWTLEQVDTDATTTFSQRSEHVMVSFKNKLWVIGGFDGMDHLNDVWSSTNGQTWTKETANAAFAARSGHACTVYDGKIWLTGGYSDTVDLFDDVWKSSDGKNWTKVSNSAEYYARSGHTMEVFAGKLWIIGGESLDANDNVVLLDDCWSSTTGLNWQQHSSIVAFFPRKLHLSGVINSRLWVWGGFGEDAYSNEKVLNDAWSTADGEFWRLESSNTAFPARCAAAGTLFNNRIWLTGGADNDPNLANTNYLNDVWATADGINWVQILASNLSGSTTQFSPRILTGAAVLTGTTPLPDKLFVSGGELGSYFLNNEVWSTQ